MIDVKAICARIGVSRTTIYKWIRQGSFPKGHGMSARCRRWEPDEVEAWIKTRAHTGSLISDCNGRAAA